MRDQFMQLTDDRSFWLNEHKYTTNRYLPEPVYLKDLYWKRPFWYGFDIQLKPLQTLEVRQTARYNFWLLAVTGMTPQAGTNNFQIQIFHVKAKPDQAQSPWQKLKTMLGGKFSRTAVDMANSVGTAGHKSWLRYPYKFSQQDTIVIQAKNLTTGTITARVTLEGVDDKTLTAAPA